jgi:1,4-alpha-glucan branching enzyme
LESNTRILKELTHDDIVVGLGSLFSELSDKLTAEEALVLLDALMIVSKHTDK